jgi:hypothetical protein
MSKRDESAVMVAKLVNQLAENGVAKTEVASRDFLPDGASQGQIQTFTDTVKWLEHEGVVRDGDSYSDGLGGVVFDLALTSRGFWLLEQKLSGDLTLGRAVASISKNEPIPTGLGDFFGGLLGAFTKSYTS